MGATKWINGAALAAVASFGASGAMAQPSDPSGFANVVDVGTGYPDSEYIAYNGLSNTQVNVHEGGFFEPGLLSSTGSNVEFNFLGGTTSDYGFALTSPGARINVASGTLISQIYITAGSLWVGGGRLTQLVDLSSTDSRVTVVDGQLDRPLSVAGGALATVSGGTLTALSVRFNGVARMNGGHTTSTSQVLFGGRLDLSGGSLPILQLFNGATANLFGSSFAIDGVPISGLEFGQAFTIPQRSGIFSGLLADGSPFSYNLAGAQAFGSSYFSPTSTLTVTLVPAPGAGLALAALLAMRRRR